MNQFDIRQFVEINSQGRAVCPSCLQAKGSNHRKTNLSIAENGAYHCFAGCTSDDIRAALGQPKGGIIPTALAQTKLPAGRSSVTVSPQRVKEAHEKLQESSQLAKQWLHQRGITDGMIARHQLGIVRAKVGDRHLPAISIPLPNHDGTAYYQKKRIAPWLSESEQPAGYQPWSQAGIPARVFFTYKPVEADQTWLCEGEWDAILLGWHVRQADLPIAVATFTCGATTVPPADQLQLLPGGVVIWYDRNDKPTKTGIIPGEAGAQKVAAALGDRGRIGQVPMPENCEIHGWDASDALNAGFTVEHFQVAASEARAIAAEPPTKRENPLRSRLVSNAELVANAPDYVEMLVPDLLPANEMIMLAAGARAGKSLLAMMLARCVATGENFLDRPVIQGAVLYVCCEDSPVKIKQREIAQGWAEDIPVYWLDRFKMSQLHDLRELAIELDVRLIILDTLSRVRDDDVTESSSEMSRVMEPYQELAQELNCCILLVHHTNKVTIDNAGTVNVFDTIRGSSAIRATCRGSIILAADNECYRLCAENGYGKIDLKIRFDTTTLEWKLIGRWAEQVSSDLKGMVIDYLNKVGQATLEQIFEETQIPKNSLYKTLSRLAGDGMITKSGNRRNVLYTRLIGLIGQSDTLSDDANVDSDESRGVIGQKNISSISTPQSDHFGESDHSTHTKHDHFGANDHFSEGGTKPINLSDNSCNPDTEGVSAIGQLSDKSRLSDEADWSVQNLQWKDPIKVLIEGNWVRAEYVKPSRRSRFCHTTRSLSDGHWVNVGKERHEVGTHDLRRAE